jgi:hypothetical protein
VRIGNASIRTSEEFEDELEFNKPFGVRAVRRKREPLRAVK